MQLRLHDVATLFSVSENTVHDWVRDASLPARWVNNTYRFNRSELIEWATLRRMPLPSLLLKGGNGDSGPSLAAALAAGGIHRNIEADGSLAAIRVALGCISQISEVDRQQVLELLEAREAAATTALGDGIAIPHPSQPLVLAAEEPLIALCFLKTGVDFQADDKQPVKALFLMIAPSSRVHLLLLAQLASALRDDGFRQTIASQASAEEILRRAGECSAAAKGS